MLSLEIHLTTQTSVEMEVADLDEARKQIMKIAEQNPGSSLHATVGTASFIGFCEGCGEPIFDSDDYVASEECDYYFCKACSEPDPPAATE